MGEKNGHGDHLTQLEFTEEKGAIDDGIFAKKEKVALEWL